MYDVIYPYGQHTLFSPLRQEFHIFLYPFLTCTYIGSIPFLANSAASLDLGSWSSRLVGHAGFDGNSPEVLQRSASGEFSDSSQTVVCIR